MISPGFSGKTRARALHRRTPPSTPPPPAKSLRIPPCNFFYRSLTYEADSELRDTENTPLLYPGGIEAYFHSEVLPHVPDAWIDVEKTVIGYEISFNKYFYVHQPLRDLEKETDGLLE